MFDFFSPIMCGSRGGGGGGGDRVSEPLSHRNHKIMGFLSNTTVQIPLKITKLPSKYSMSRTSLPRQRNAILMAFCWWADDGPILVVFGSTHY